MRIGIIIGRIGGIDGVALETEKWIDVLKRMGHDVFIVSGQFEERKMNPETETLVPEMSFFSPESYWGQKKAFFYPEADPEELIYHINFYSDIIAGKIENWIKDRKIDVLISENASALPAHLSMGQEAAAVGQALTLDKDDLIFGSHRSHGEIFQGRHGSAHRHRGRRSALPARLFNLHAADRRRCARREALRPPWRACPRWNPGPRQTTASRERSRRRR